MAFCSPLNHAPVLTHGWETSECPSPPLHATYRFPPSRPSRTRAGQDWAQSPRTSSFSHPCCHVHRHAQPFHTPFCAQLHTREANVLILYRPSSHLLPSKPTWLLPQRERVWSGCARRRGAATTTGGWKVAERAALAGVRGIEVVGSVQSCGESKGAARGGRTEGDVPWWTRLMKTTTELGSRHCNPSALRKGSRRLKLTFIWAKFFLKWIVASEGAEHEMRHVLSKS